MPRLTGGERNEPVPAGADFGSPLSSADLQRAVRAVDAGALLVAPRILRRVIKRDRGLTGFGLRVPHRKSYVISRDALLQIVEFSELGLDDGAALPESVVLLARPNGKRLADSSGQQLLTRCWRLLYHARVHLALEAKAASGQLTAPIIRQRVQVIGFAAFNEIRSVLTQEEMLLPPPTELAVYVEFAATYLELQWFAPSFLPRYFPGLEDHDAVNAMIREDLDAAALFAATRPAGAADPVDSREWDQWADLPSELAVGPLPSGKEELPEPDAFADGERVVSPSRFRALMRKSQRPAKLGNIVRAAICHAKAAECAPSDLTHRSAETIKTDVHRMATRLQSALEIDPSAMRCWEDSLLALVRQAPRGIWTVEARLLYDLQKACIDHERDVYTVDLVEWILSLGRRPIRRRLPAQRDVLLVKHLRSAERRLAAAHVTDSQRRQLAQLLCEAIHRAEARLRQQLRPRIVAALDHVGLLPTNLPERVARKKLVEELLDRIQDRGFLGIGDLRDAISRNRLKLPDLVAPLQISSGEGLLRRAGRVMGAFWQGAVHLFRGDQLLQADRRLALTLDGVYRRGEIYMRWLQRLSAPNFGTAIGRFLTRFLTVPFGGAFVSVVGVVEIWGLFARTFGAAPSNGHGRHGHEFELSATQIYIILALGFFLLGVINSARFRAAVASFGRAVSSLLSLLLIEPIRWLARSPLLLRFFRSRLFAAAFRFLIKPALWAGAIWWLLRVTPPHGADWRTSGGTGLSLYLSFSLLLNTRFGRNVEEVLADWTVQGWHRFGVRLIVGIFWFFVDVFRSVVEAVERLIYSVDEWLRFRTGESRTLLAGKAVMGAVWFFFAYVLRFAVNVLIEPQFNPIKHFPVVTVAHKLLLGLYAPFAHLLETAMDGPLAWTVSLTVIWCIPGIFGFLVWELKENWRLYAANRRRGLGPVMIGSHGETMGRLLRPGFHSGTLPKRYAKLRVAERHARTDGGWRTVHKRLRALEHVAIDLRRYVEREFLELFAESRVWRQAPPRLHDIRLSTNSVRLSLRCDAIDVEPLELAIDARFGWLLAGIRNPGWLDHISPQERQMVVTALMGLYKTAGIELVRQQIEAEFPPPVPEYDIRAEGLVLWPDQQEDVEVLYDLREGQWIAPQSIRGLTRRRLPTIERQRILFSDMPVPWNRWVQLWEQDFRPADSGATSVHAVAVLTPRLAGQN